MKKRLIYINLDGFAWHLYQDVADKRKTLPGIYALSEYGTLFTNARTGIPSITVPMQTAILSGCYSAGTRNCYHYWDFETDRLVKLGRHNSAQTFGQVLLQAGRSCVSIQQFGEEDKGCRWDTPRNLYIQPAGDHNTRFNILFSLLSNKAFFYDGKRYAYPELPDVIMLYADDLDSIGHNHGLSPAPSEELRVHRVMEGLQAIDSNIRRLTALLQSLGLWENTYLLLTTDHGMVHCTGRSRAGELASFLESKGFGAVVVGESSTKPGSPHAIRLISAGIQCQLYLTKGRDEILEQKIKSEVSQLPFVETVLDSGQLSAAGCDERFAHLLISPREGEHFNTNKPEVIGIRASHDSLHEKCSHIYAALVGPGIRAGHVREEKTYNIDFIPTLCQLDLPPDPCHATGQVLSDIMTS